MDYALNYKLDYIAELQDSVNLIIKEDSPKNDLVGLIRLEGMLEEHGYDLFLVRYFVKKEVIQLPKHNGSNIKYSEGFSNNVQRCIDIVVEEFKSKEGYTPPKGIIYGNLYIDFFFKFGLISDMANRGLIEFPLQTKKDQQKQHIKLNSPEEFCSPEELGLVMY